MGSGRMKVGERECTVLKHKFDLKKLETVGFLGGGHFGVVYKAIATGLDERHPSATTVVAVKKLRLMSSENEKISFDQEIELALSLMNLVKHPNIIKFYGAITNVVQKRLIMEYCEFGSLKQFLKTQNTNDDDLTNFCWQVARGMEFLGFVDLVHRDLAARNVLVASDLVLKICDFGLTRRITDFDNYLLKNNQIPVPFKTMAPESLRNGTYSVESDVWSYGILCWEIFSLGDDYFVEEPRKRSSKHNTIEKFILKLETTDFLGQPERCSDETFAIIKACWKLAPKERPSFTHLKDTMSVMVDPAIVSKFENLISNTDVAVIDVDTPLLTHQNALH